MSAYFPGNDYVAVSKFRTEGVHEWQSREGETDATLIAAALDAQTQATLALAFEQRTLVLVTEKSVLTATMMHAVASGQTPSPDVLQKIDTFAKEINARLGLNEGDSK